ncbi:MAG: hypothetical protein ACREKM_10660, partial [Longimicrobiales bacterium]
MQRTDVLTIRIETVAEACANLGFLAFVIVGVFLASKVLLALAMIWGAVYLVYDIGRRGGRVGTVLLVFLAGVFVSYPLVIMNNGLSSGFMHGGMVLGSAGVALHFAVTRRTRLVALTLWSLLILYLLRVLILGHPADAVFLGSQNRVSTLLLALAVLLLAVRRARSDLLLAGLVVLACVIAGGSSGIVGAALVFALVVMREAAAPGRHAFRTRVLLLITVAALAGAVWSVLSEEALMKLAIDRFVGGDVRFQIIREYAQTSLHGVNVLAGTKLVYAFEVIDNGALMTLGNLHNSYLSAHSKTGIFALFVL